MKTLLNVDDLAKYLKLRKQTIYNWLNQRKISGMKIGGVWHFDKREIDKWLQSQARKANKYRTLLKNAMKSNVKVYNIFFIKQLHNIVAL